MKKPLIAICMLALGGLVLVSLLRGCNIQKPKYPGRDRPSIEVTLSSDGQLVAVMDHVGEQKKPRLRIKWVEKDEPWQELPVPMYTSSVRFSLKGYELLLTHDLPSDVTIGELIRWDVSDLSKAPVIIHQGPYLSFPIEVKPNQYLARSCIPLANIMQAEGRNSCATSNGATGAEWMLIRPRQEPVQLTPRPRSTHVIYSQPNVTDQGFFWFISAGLDGKTPQLMSFAFPDGKAPEWDLSRFSPDSQLQCDYHAKRCLRSYVAATHPKTSAFIYDKEVIFGDQRCQPEGFRGYADKPEITPDGRVAVIPLAADFYAPRDVVVLKFKEGQCEPTSIQRISLKETQAAEGATPPRQGRAGA